MSTSRFNSAAGSASFSPNLTGVITEEFLMAPSSQQRARLAAVTGDRRFQNMPEQELHRFIENLINQLGAQQSRQARGAQIPEAALDPQMVAAMDAAAGRNDVETAERILRSMREQAGNPPSGRNVRTQAGSEGLSGQRGHVSPLEVQRNANTDFAERPTPKQIAERYKPRKAH